MILRWRYASRKRTQSLRKSQIQHTFLKQELDGTAFTQPRYYWSDSKYELNKGLDEAAFIQPRTYSKEKVAELMNGEAVELPDEPLVHEIMSPPAGPYKPRGRKATKKTHYAAYVNIKKVKKNRMSNSKVSPPISKFCISCGPIRRNVVDLNRTLPPTPIFMSPRTSRLSTPLPNSRRVPRTPVQKFPNR